MRLNVVSATSDELNAPGQAEPRVTAGADSAAPDTPALEVTGLRAAYGSQVAVHGISFSVAPGEFVTLLGPSGCGKTTTLRCIAGLEVPVGGTIAINGTVVSSPGRHVPAQKRGINMVFQSYAIWPHMSVEQNVSYGLRNRGTSKAEIKRRTAEALEMVGLGGYEKRYGTELSGGQQQRVAVARAVVTEPQILLFDEPLSNLDAGLRERMREELLMLQRRIGRTAIYVTHDQTEAMAMSDRIVLMNGGVIEQVATPRDLYHRPPSRFAATFVGTTNLIEGTVALESGTPVFRGEGLELVLPAGSAQGPGAVAFRPESVQVGERATGTVNRFTARVVSAAFLGARCDVTLSLGGARVRVETTADFDPTPGSAVAVALPVESLSVLGQ
jgi:ABC-type Fe3+/spermidine/putrescine transport system ATPase subunit